MRLCVIICCFVCFSFSVTRAQFSAQEIVSKAIKVSGGDTYDNVSIYFTFRNKKYQSNRKNGSYQLERFINNAKGVIHDVVSNNGLRRTIDNCRVVVADSLISRISDGVNSVHYFASLPYGLDAPAVKKEMIGESSIKGIAYYKIKVTFTEEGGGTDFEDEFLYWIHKKNFTVDYLAYKYAVNGGGIRFREAYNTRDVNGVRFADYRNYKIDDLSTPLAYLDTMFEKKLLKLVSKIELNNIHVRKNKCC